MPKIEICEQGSPEWLMLKKGVISASRAGDLLTPAKRKTYARCLVSELLCAEPPDSFTSFAMQWGLDHEDEARARYEFETGSRVEEIGFAWLDGFDGRIGFSPDGIVGDGLVEIKCPSSKAHVDHMLDGAPKDYHLQMQFQMLVMDKAWCDFVSYDPRMSPGADYYCKRYPRNEATHKELLSGAMDVLAMTEKAIGQIQGA